jgi:hypothetical protein
MGLRWTEQKLRTPPREILNQLVREGIDTREKLKRWDHYVDGHKGRSNKQVKILARHIAGFEITDVDEAFGLVLHHVRAEMRMNRFEE